MYRITTYRTFIKFCENYLETNLLTTPHLGKKLVSYPDFSGLHWFPGSLLQIKNEMAAFTSLFIALMFFPPLFLTANSELPIPDETWGYVEVRKGASMFWWLYGAQVKDPAERVHKPLVLWLQGGPGASSTGYGNFEELGPLDVHLEPRNTTWITEANVLFVDNPVGCGYSYVVDAAALTTNISGISL